VLLMGLTVLWGESRTKYKYTSWINVEFMYSEAASCEGRVLLCGPTACPKVCLDAARPVTTRYGVCPPHSRCEIACCYGTLWLITVFTKSLESSTRSLELFLFFSGDKIEKNEIAWHVARMGVGVYRVLVGKPEGKGHL
jgi:hypothetical protein